MTQRSITRIEERIYLLRGERVMLDVDLAELYGVTTKALNQSVKRNYERFPGGFLFRLTYAEFRQVVTNCDHSSAIRNSPRPPSAFTEHGVAMLASVLRSPRAIATSVAIIRAFIQLRQIALNYTELATRIDALEARYDDQFKEIFEAIRRLLEPVERDEPHEPIGFTTE